MKVKITAIVRNGEIEKLELMHPERQKMRAEFNLVPGRRHVQYIIADLLTGPLEVMIVPIFGRIEIEAC